MEAHNHILPTHDDAVDFVIEAGRALHQFGLPAHRLEPELVALSRKLGAPAQFFATPTAILAEFNGHHGQGTRLIRVEPGGVDLGKLVSLDEVAQAVGAGTMTARDGLQAVQCLLRAPSRYSPATVVASFALAAAGASVFFGGGWREIVASGAIGLCAGLLTQITARVPSMQRLFEPIAAFVGGFIAMLATSVLGSTSAIVSACAGLIVLVPGLTLTIGITELASRHLSSGTARLTGALLVFLQMGFGVALGMKAGGALATALGGNTAMLEPGPNPTWVLWVALAATPLALTVLFQARRRDLVWIFPACVIAFLSARGGTIYLGPEMGAFVGAFTIGLFSSLFVRLTRKPASVTLVPGLVLLVPGSLGFRSLSALIATDVLSGIQLAFTMTLVAIALVTGLLLATAIVPARNSR